MPTFADQLIAREHTLDKFSWGVALFMLGFAKKILLANAVAQVADAVFAAQSPSTLDAWFGALAYTFQLYFDFSAYSEMAIGLGLMLGFECPRNFDAPYRADSFSDFWRRWHISLSSWLRDYLYIPLGGNRAGAGRTYVNLMIVFLLCGLWHGAGWTFLVWGAWHGFWLVVERVLGRKPFYAALPASARVLVTLSSGHGRLGHLPGRDAGRGWETAGRDVRADSGAGRLDAPECHHLHSRPSPHHGPVRRCWCSSRCKASIGPGGSTGPESSCRRACLLFL